MIPFIFYPLPPPCKAFVVLGEGVVNGVIYFKPFKCFYSDAVIYKFSYQKLILLGHESIFKHPDSTDLSSLPCITSFYLRLSSSTFNSLRLRYLTFILSATNKFHTLPSQAKFSRGTTHNGHPTKYNSPSAYASQPILSSLQHRSLMSHESQGSSI